MEDYFKIGDKNIKTLRGISDFFRQNPSTEIMIIDLDNVVLGYDLLCVHSSVSLIDFRKTLSLLHQKKIKALKYEN